MQYLFTGSDTEKIDIRKAYVNGKGCLNYMMNCIPFMAIEDEPRISVIVKEWIATGEVPEFKLFTEEPSAKRKRRHKKYTREALEAREVKKEMEAKKKQENRSGGSGGGSGLQELILARQAQRGQNSDNFFDALMQKYGGADDSEEYVFPEKKGKKAKKAPAKNGKAPERRVRSGRVSK